MKPDGDAADVHGALIAPLRSREPAYETRIVHRGATPLSITLSSGGAGLGQRLVASLLIAALLGLLLVASAALPVEAQELLWELWNFIRRSIIPRQT